MLLLYEIDLASYRAFRVNLSCVRCFCTSPFLLSTWDSVLAGIGARFRAPFALYHLLSSLSYLVAPNSLKFSILSLSTSRPKSRIRLRKQHGAYIQTCMIAFSSSGSTRLVSMRHSSTADHSQLVIVISKTISCIKRRMSGKNIQSIKVALFRQTSFPRYTTPQNSQ